MLGKHLHGFLQDVPIFPVVQHAGRSAVHISACADEEEDDEEERLEVEKCRLGDHQLVFGRGATSQSHHDLRKYRASVSEGLSRA